MTTEYCPEMLGDLLPIYYRRLFPYDSYCRWLGAGNVDKSYLARREFSFTLEGDIYLRYQSFSNAQDLQKEMVNKRPVKIDVGAIFNARPSDHKKVANFQPQEKELVFDIDMTDYDDIRTCCEGASICNKCWPFMTVALKILDRALRQDFGFKHLLWVYSGRRGIHCWVSDPIAKRLGQTGRAAVAEYLQVITGGEARAKKVNLRFKEIHPHIAKSLDIVKANFEKLCLHDQDILANESRWTKVLALIPDEGLRKDIAEMMPKHKSSVERWNAIHQRVQSFLKYEKKSGHRTNANILNEIMLQFAYPRLDIAVSKGLNHLLKSPFCIHPKTGRVCIPIDPAKCDSFDPMTVPTILQLTDEIDRFEKEEKDKNVSKDYKKTSLREPMKVFDEFLSKLSENWRGKLMEKSDASKNF